MTDTLIAVFTCERDKKWLTVARETWLRDVPKTMDVLICDGTVMPVGTKDTYENLPHKTKAACRYALERNYRWLFKFDVDGYLRPKLLAAPVGHDYAGRVRGPSGGEISEHIPNTASFCSGGAYWLSRRAIDIIAQADFTADTSEDRWVGNTLAKWGITPTHVRGFVAPTHLPVSDYMRSPECVALMQLEEPEQMRRIYQGIFDPPVAPAGSQARHFPDSSPLRAQMGKGR